ncbi:MAG: NERD domain-containing protein [Sulfuricaulis sp.]
MATILPSTRPKASDRISSAELDVLGRLESLPNDWIVLHSLWLKTHRVKQDAEADIVVISDRAVLVVEIKGGDVWRDDEGWHFRPKRGGEESVKREGPIDQARGAYYALRSHLSEIGREDLVDGYVWGYGAILVDCTLQVGTHDAGIDEEMIVDQRRYPSGLGGFVSGLASYWAPRVQGQTHHAGRQPRPLQLSISSQARQQIASLLRPRLDRVVGVAAHVAGSESSIWQLTEQQMSALDYAAAEPRNLLIGSAGTGKTFLAVEQARRKVADGLRVLFVCFNGLLARTIAAEFQNPASSAITVINYHQLALGLVRHSGRTIEFCEDWASFDERLREHLVDIVSDIRDSDRYDYLIVDEAQDLMSESFLDLLDCLLRGGLKNGSWLVAVDTQQAIFRNHFDKRKFEDLCEHGRKTTLDINCRNTREIATFVHAMSGIGSVSVRSARGQMPAVRYYADRTEYIRILKKVVNELIQSFLNAALSPAEIVILALDKSFLPAEIRQPGFFLRLAKDIDPANPDRESIRIGTIQAFKGLESSAVVLVGFDRFDQDLYRDLFYVGASRARAVLRLLLPENCDHVKRALPEIIRLLAI